MRTYLAGVHFVSRDHFIMVDRKKTGSLELSEGKEQPLPNRQAWRERSFLARLTGEEGPSFRSFMQPGRISLLVRLINHSINAWMDDRWMAGWDRPLFSIEIPRYKGVVQLVCLNGLVGLAGQVQSRLIPFYQFNRGYLPNSFPDYRKAPSGSLAAEKEVRSGEVRVVTRLIIRRA